LGEIEIMEELSREESTLLKRALFNSGLELMEDKKGILIEEIKKIILDMVYQTGEIVKTSFPEYLSEKMNHDYPSLSNLFSEVQGITIGQFLIFHKIERIKELIVYGELSMTEIAWRMNYSSVAHLSNQFKKISGFTPTHYKQLKNLRKESIQELNKSIPNI